MKIDPDCYYFGGCIGMFDSSVQSWEGVSNIFFASPLSNKTRPASVLSLRGRKATTELIHILIKIGEIEWL